MITTLTRADSPKVFEFLDANGFSAFIVDEDKEHRRGSTFYISWYLQFEEDVFPENPELHGFWMTNNFVWSDIDFDKRDITELYRVEKVKKVIETEEWKLVENV